MVQCLHNDALKDKAEDLTVYTLEEIGGHIPEPQRRPGSLYRDLGDLTPTHLAKRLDTLSGD